MRLSIIKSTLILVAFLSSLSLWGQGNSPRRLEILFLGDNGHHKPIERFSEIMPALGNKGINFTYTDKLEDINLNYLNSSFDLRGFGQRNSSDSLCLFLF